MDKKVNEVIFKAVKEMSRGGFTIESISEITNLAPATISRIRHAIDLEDYRDDCARATRKAREKKARQKADAAPVEPVLPQVETRQEMNPTVIRVEATHYMMEELHKTNEYLKLISAKLAFIVDELCGTGTKEG